MTQKEQKEGVGHSSPHDEGELFKDYEGISVQDRAYFILSMLNQPRLEHRGRLVVNMKTENNKVQRVKIAVDGEDSLNLSQKQIKNEASKYYHYVKMPEDFFQSINANHLTDELLSDERQPKHHYSIHKNNSGKDIDSYAYSYDVHNSRVSKYPNLLEFKSSNRVGKWNMRYLTFERNFEGLGERKNAFFQQFFTLLDIAYLVQIEGKKELSEIEIDDLELINSKSELWNIKQQYAFWVNNSINPEEEEEEEEPIFSCDKCDFTTKSEVGLKVHKTKMEH